MTSDPTAAIAAALARLRGPRPRPPWEGGPHDGPSHLPGHGPRGHHPPGEMLHGGPPWGGRGRFGDPARVRMLEALAAASAPLSVGEVAAAVGVDQPRASRLVQQAADHGFVRREADPDDARRTRIALTDLGAQVAARFSGGRREAVRTALADFSEPERAELARLLVKLAAAWPEG